jgi:outer membrane protein assembly factor BamE (lipoprotein component of BamABCDE complex)
LALLLLSGCIIIPIPWDRGKPVYTQEQLAKIQVGLSSRQQIASELGNNYLLRLDGRYWVYYWTEESGMIFALPLLPYLPGGDGGPVNVKRSIMFLEFDDNGLLISKQFGTNSAENSIRYCTANSLCLEHTVVKGHSQSSGRPIYDFDSLESAFTINGSAKDSVHWPEIATDRCIVVIWPNASDWKQTQGVRLEVDGPSPGSHFYFWLPVDSFCAVSLSPEIKTVRVTTTRGSSIGPMDDLTYFNCEAGQTTYLEVGTVIIDRGWLARDQVNVVLKSIDQETGRKTIANMPRLLPP